MKSKLHSIFFLVQLCVSWAIHAEGSYEVPPVARFSDVELRQVVEPNAAISELGHEEWYQRIVTIFPDSTIELVLVSFNAQSPVVSRFIWNASDETRDALPEGGLIMDWQKGHVFGGAKALAVPRALQLDQIGGLIRILDDAPAELEPVSSSLLMTREPMPEEFPPPISPLKFGSGAILRRRSLAVLVDGHLQPLWVHENRKDGNVISSGHLADARTVGSARLSEIFETVALIVEATLSRFRNDSPNLVSPSDAEGRRLKTLHPTGLDASPNGMTEPLMGYANQLTNKASCVGTLAAAASALSN